MDCISTVQLFLDVLIVVQSLKLVKENFKVLLNFSSVFSSDVFSDILALFTRVHLECLANFLEVSTVPVEESRVKQDLLLSSVHFSELDVFHTLKVAAVL